MAKIETLCSECGHVSELDIGHAKSCENCGEVFTNYRKAGNTVIGDTTALGCGVILGLLVLGIASWAAAVWLIAWIF
jgi:hypothetical protein